MTIKPISYKSGQRTVQRVSSATVLETGEKDGIKHVWSGHVDTSNRVNFTWNIDWEDLKSQGVYRLVGGLRVNSVLSYWDSAKVKIDCMDTNYSVFTAIGSNYSSYAVTFEYWFNAYYAELLPPEKISYDKMFLASNKTDVVLIVDGKELNVNKSFLSFHSDYFSTLFSANFKEGKMDKIEIKEVRYEDFALLLSSFYPNPQFPNDETVEKLLEMANRFQVTSVIGIVEYHLLNNSKIEYEKMIWLADEYVMTKLLAKCISQMDSSEKAKMLKKSPEFEKLSHKTRSLVFERLLEFI
ncbi:unnamed protein product [Caenorhabditis nigoni]